MGHITKPFSFGNGDIIDAVKFESIHDIIYNEFNGNIDNANIKSGAAIEGTKIASAPNGIGTDQLNNDSVTAAKLKDSASTDADRAVTTDHIRDGAVTADKLATDSVTQLKIPDGILGLDKLKNLVYEEVAFTVTAPSDYVHISIHTRRKTSGSNYIAEVSCFFFSNGGGPIGAFGNSVTQNVTPTTNIPTATKQLLAVYLADIVYNVGHSPDDVTGKVIFISADKDS